MDGSLCYHFERQTACLKRVCFQYFLLQAQTKSLLVVGDHKFQVMIVTNKKYILQGSQSTKACYSMNYLDCAEYPHGSKGWGILNNLSGGAWSQ